MQRWFLDEWLSRDAAFISADLRLGVGVESSVALPAASLLPVGWPGLVYVDLRQRIRPGMLGMVWVVAQGRREKARRIS
jgi:hypothetical protein